MLLIIRNLSLAFVGIVMLWVVCSLLYSPEIEQEAKTYPEDQVEALKRERAHDYQPEDRIRFHQVVDYSLGEKAPWYPQGQSPVLDALVKAGQLPPVEERVGPEPVVLLGPDGIGNFGGTMITASVSKRAVGNFGHYYAGTHLVRWSPLGDPIVPHVAKDFEVRDEGREFIFYLREGMRWSDGHPFTAEDILYWWEQEASNPGVSTEPEGLMEYRGKTGTVEKIDDYTIVFRFDEPNGLFLGKLAGSGGIEMCGSPAHYLRPYHPTEGDPELIESAMKAWQMPTARALYNAIKEWDNPEHPRIWPFIYRSYQANSPYAWVRNPYYFAVDPEGNQLPYLDRVLFTTRSRDLIPIASANGEFSYKHGLSVEHYTILMSQREEGDYEVRHYSFGDGSMAAIFPNMTKRRGPAYPNAGKKEALMRKKAFRIALSLAINREAIIEVEYGGISEAAQAAPGPTSPYFNEDLYYAYVEHDPERANAMLDEIGLTQRDAEGYRTFPDGSTMSFYLTYKAQSRFSGAMAQSIVEDWAKVGIRVVFKEQATQLYHLDRAAMIHDFMVGPVPGQAYALVDPHMYVPTKDSFYAMAWGFWYFRGGYYGVEIPEGQGAYPPPEDHPLMDAIRIYDDVIQETDEVKQNREFQKILDIAAENLWTINIASPPPKLTVVKNGFKNVPRQGMMGWTFLSPANLGFENYYWEDPQDSEGAIEQIQRSIIQPLGRSDVPSDLSAGAVGGGNPVNASTFIRWILTVILLGALLVGGIRFPFVGNRILLMVPTLLVVSILVFIIIELPPGDYSTSLIAQAEAMGEEADLQKIEEVQELFLLDASWTERYLIWSGLKWFTTYKVEDKGLLQGDLGRSMETLEPVEDVVGDRFLLTACIGIGTILFTWVVALPIGIFSAVKQYSLADYIFTVIGFLGMCVPNFLLALLLMYFTSKYFGIDVSGLFSSEYAAQPEWTYGKFMDLLAHLWVPVVVIGTGGTASMIRIMRGNLLDELKKPYVTTARAKGVRPFKLILKYPVRLALNPFISGIGHLFPQMISGGAIVALILSLPTIGPLLLHSLLMEDMYLAGSLLIILSTLGIIGTLVSDLLLMMLDPRIRMEGGRR